MRDGLSISCTACLPSSCRPCGELTIPVPRVPRFLTLCRKFGHCNGQYDNLCSKCLRICPDRLGLVQVLLALLDSSNSSPSSSLILSPLSSSSSSAAAAGTATGSGMRWGDRESAVCRVLAVECLHLLSADGGYAIRVREILNSSKVRGTFAVLVVLRESM